MVDQRTETVRLLEAADAMLYSTAVWVRGALAIDSDMKSVIAYSPEACRWCATGALAAAAGVEGTVSPILGPPQPWDAERSAHIRTCLAAMSARDCLNKAAFKLHGRDAIAVNDRFPGTFAAVKEMYAVAIEIAQERAAS